MKVYKVCVESDKEDDGITKVSSSGKNVDVKKQLGISGEKSII